MVPDFWDLLPRLADDLQNAAVEERMCVAGPDDDGAIGPASGTGDGYHFIARADQARIGVEPCHQVPYFE